MRRDMKRGMMMGIMKVQVNLKRKTKIAMKMSNLNYYSATFFCFFWSPARFKDKEKKSRSDLSSLRDFYLLDLGYSALYLADVAIY